MYGLYMYDNEPIQLDFSPFRAASMSERTSGSAWPKDNKHRDAQKQTIAAGHIINCRHRRTWTNQNTTCGAAMKGRHVQLCLTFSFIVSDADVCLRKMLAIPTRNDRSSGTWRAISDVMRWHPLLGAVIVTVRCAQPAVPVLICRVMTQKDGVSLEFAIVCICSIGSCNIYAHAKTRILW